jgi:hypothetical protein
MDLRTSTNAVIFLSCTGGALDNFIIRKNVKPAARQSGARSDAALLRIHFLLCRHFLIRDRQ